MKPPGSKGANALQKDDPMIDPTKPLSTKEGERVELLSFKGRGKFTIVGYIGKSTLATSWTAEGQFCLDGPDERDLVNLPCVYLNIYPDGIAQMFASRLDADMNATGKRVGRMCVEIKEGEYDD